MRHVLLARGLPDLPGGIEVHDRSAHAHEGAAGSAKVTLALLGDFFRRRGVEQLYPLFESDLGGVKGPRMTADQG